MLASKNRAAYGMKKISTTNLIREATRRADRIPALRRKAERMQKALQEISAELSDLETLQTLKLSTTGTQTNGTATRPSTVHFSAAAKTRRRKSGGAQPHTVFKRNGHSLAEMVKAAMLEAGRPLRAREISDAVQKAGYVGTIGKHGVLSAVGPCLSINKTFKRVEPGLYTVA